MTSSIPCSNQKPGWCSALEPDEDRDGPPVADSLPSHLVPVPGTLFGTSRNHVRISGDAGGLSSRFGPLSASRWSIHVGLCWRYGKNKQNKNCFDAGIFKLHLNCSFALLFRSPTIFHCLCACTLQDDTNVFKGASKLNVLLKLNQNLWSFNVKITSNSIREGITFFT